MKKSIKTFSLILLVGLVLGLLPCFAQNTESVFVDVPENEWFAESVEYVKDKGLMNGITVTTFEPKTSITRGMIVTIIYRLEGAPKVNSELQFSDVNPTYYYCTPIIWASENGIVNGYNKDTFAPDDEITREQFATILYRYAENKGIDVSFDAEKIKLSDYEDAEEISDYAVNAISWANETGLIKGVTLTTLEPQGKATRAQAATIFMRFDKLIKESEQSDSSTETKEDETDNKEIVSGKNDNSSSNNDSGSKKDPTESDDKNDVNNGEDNYDDDKNAGEWDDVKDEKPGGNTSGDDLLKDDPANNDPVKDENDNEKEDYDIPTISVESVFAKAGDAVSVKVELHDNPGILGMLVSFEYDETVMKLVDVQNGNVFSKSNGYTFMGPKNKASGCRASWYTLNDIPVETDGTFVTLCFEMLEDVSSGTYSVKIKYNKDDIFGEKSVDPDIKNGEITIK